MSGAETGFVDIMRERRASNSSDLCWVLKDHEARLPCPGAGTGPSTAALKREILDSDQFRYDLRLLADQTGRSESELAREAAGIVDGMGHRLGMRSIRLMGYALSKLIKRLFGAVLVNTAQLGRLRELYRASGGPVVLLPTHRSYADFLLVSYVMFECDLPMPVIAAAMDFQSMRLVGRLLRHCGAFFMRRSFAGDPLYWSVFSRYVQALLQHRADKASASAGTGQPPLEFFIEGTRSRTNKALTPKIGLLGIILECWLSTGVPDVTLVPIGISYERVLEEHLYAWELLGVPKPRETTSGLLRVRRHLMHEHYGNIIFNVGEPISLRDMARAHGVTRVSHNLELRFKPNLFAHEKQFLARLARLVVTNQQRCVVLSDWSVLVLVLLAQPGMRMPRSHLARAFMSTVQLLQHWGALVASCCLGDRRDESMAKQIESVHASIDRALALHTTVLAVIPADPRDPCDPSASASASGGDETSLIALVAAMAGSDRDGGGVDVDESERIARVILTGTCRNPVLFHVATESILLARLRHGPVVAPGDGDGGVDGDVDTVLALMAREFIQECDSLRQVRERAQTRLTDASGTRDIDMVIIERAVRVHLTAYLVYGRAFIHLYGDVNSNSASANSNSAVISAVEQCGAVQSATRRWCGVHARSLGPAFLEMCSLDMVRNAVTSFRMLHNTAVATSNMSPDNNSSNSLPWQPAPTRASNISHALHCLERCLPIEIRERCAWIPP